jgi:hypothetical protein
MSLWTVSHRLQIEDIFIRVPQRLQQNLCERDTGTAEMHEMKEKINKNVRSGIEPLKLKNPEIIKKIITS